MAHVTREQPRGQPGIDARVSTSVVWGRRWLLPLGVAAGCGGLGPDAARATTVPHAGVHDDRRLHAYIESVTRCVVEASGVAATIEILDVASVAAYARPGDRVELSRGLLAHLRSEAELEAVTAHELAHLAAGHVEAEESEPAAASSSGLGLLAEIVGAARVAAHSRAQEREADAKAVQYLHACGRSAHAMVELFDVLERLDDEDDDDSSWFTTHPSFAERRSRLRAPLDEASRRDPGRAPYVEALAGLVYGEDPRAGFVSAGDYIVPALDVRLALPRAWSSRVEDGMLVSQSPERKAFLAVQRVEAGHGPARLEAALVAGGFADGEIDRYELGSARVTVAGFGLGPAGGIIVHLELEAVALLLFGVAPRDDWAAFAGEIQRAIESFGRIEDRELVGVQPLRIGVVRLDRAATLAAVADSARSALDVAALAELNGVPATAVLPAGTVLKTVIDPPSSRARARP